MPGKWKGKSSAPAEPSMQESILDVKGRVEDRMRALKESVKRAEAEMQTKLGAGDRDGAKACLRVKKVATQDIARQQKNLDTIDELIGMLVEAELNRDVYTKVRQGTDKVRELLSGAGAAEFSALLAEAQVYREEFNQIGEAMDEFLDSRVPNEELDAEVDALFAAPAPRVSAARVGDVRQDDIDALMT